MLAEIDLLVCLIKMFLKVTCLEFVFNVVFKSYTKFNYRFFFTFDFFLLFHLCLRCFNSFNKINVKIVYEYVGIILNLFKQKKVKQMTSVIVYYVYITLKY